MTITRTVCDNLSVHGIDPEPPKNPPGRKPKKTVPIWCRFRSYMKPAGGWGEWRIWQRYHSADSAKQAFKNLRNKHKPFIEFSLTEPEWTTSKDKTK